MELRLKKLGVIKNKKLKNNFDEIYDIYKQKALNLNLFGDIMFINEHGKTFIYVVL